MEEEEVQTRKINTKNLFLLWEPVFLLPIRWPFCVAQLILFPLVMVCYFIFCLPLGYVLERFETSRGYNVGLATKKRMFQIQSLFVKRVVFPGFSSWQRQCVLAFKLFGRPVPLSDLMCLKHSLFCLAKKKTTEVCTRRPPGGSGSKPLTVRHLRNWWWSGWFVFFIGTTFFWKYRVCEMASIKGRNCHPHMAQSDASLRLVRWEVDGSVVLAYCSTPLVWSWKFSGFDFKVFGSSDHGNNQSWLGSWFFWWIQCTGQYYLRLTFTETLQQLKIPPVLTGTEDIPIRVAGVLTHSPGH